jgi:CDP-diacylglycerol--glycerol-3-phosphate 3-phosphatidyltransferase
MNQKTFTDTLRELVSHIVTPIGKTLNAVGISPDVITVLGLVVVAVGAWRLAEGAWTQAALILMAGLPLDTLDGATARAYGKFRPFGSFLDSTLDRYADALIFGGIALYYAREGRFEFTVISIIALHGAMMVSYIRAKAESLDISLKEGWFTRVERLLALLGAWILSLFIGQTGVDIGIAVLAVGTQLTSIQRMVYVSRKLSIQQAEKERA